MIIADQILILSEEVPKMKTLLRPDIYLRSIYDLNIEELKKINIEVILIDIDNTLVSWDTKEADAKVLSFIDKLLREGFKLCIVSNGTSERVNKFTEPMRIPAICNAGKPFKHAYKKAMKIVGGRPDNTAMIGDQLFTDILGGNRLGLYTILVSPISKKEFLWTKFMRIIEKNVIKNIQKDIEG